MHFLSSKKHIRNLKEFENMVFSYALKNQNLNKCNIKRTMGVSMFKIPQWIYIF